MPAWLPTYALLDLAFVAGGLLAAVGMVWDWPFWVQVVVNLVALVLLAVALGRARRWENRS